MSTKCQCGCELFEDSGNFTFCTECGAQASQIALKNDVNFSYSGNLVSSSTNVAGKYLSSKIYSSDGQTPRAQKLKRITKRIYEVCGKLSLPEGNLVAKTALNIFEEHFHEHRATATRIIQVVYTACVVNDCPVNLKDIRKHLSTKKANAQGSIHALSFCRRYMGRSCDVARKPQFGRLADYMDLEKSGVVPEGKSSVFMKEYGELKEILQNFIRTTLQTATRDKYVFVISTLISYKHHTGLDHTPQMIDRWFTNTAKENFQKSYLVVMKSLEAHAAKRLPWLQRSKQTSFFARKLDIILQHKHLLACTTTPPQHNITPPPQPSQPPASLELSPVKRDRSLEVVEIDEKGEQGVPSAIIKDEIWTLLLRNGVSFTSVKSAETSVNKMYQLLYHYQLRHHCESFPGSVVAALAHQCASIYESKIPSLTAVFPSYSYIIEMDHLIRLTVIKMVLVFCPDELPWEMKSSEVCSRVLKEIPTYYPRLVKSRAFKDIIPAPINSRTPITVPCLWNNSSITQHQMPFPPNEIETKAGLVSSSSTSNSSEMSVSGDSSELSAPGDSSSGVFTEHCGSLVQEIVQILNTLTGVRERGNGELRIPRSKHLPR